MEKDKLVELMQRLFGDADQTPIAAKVKISRRPKTRVAAALRSHAQPK